MVEDWLLTSGWPRHAWAHKRPLFSSWSSQINGFLSRRLLAVNSQSLTAATSTTNEKEQTMGAIIKKRCDFLAIWREIGERNAGFDKQNGGHNCAAGLLLGAVTLLLAAEWSKQKKRTTIIGRLPSVRGAACLSSQERGHIGTGDSDSDGDTITIVMEITTNTIAEVEVEMYRYGDQESRPDIVVLFVEVLLVLYH